MSEVWWLLLGAGIGVVGAYVTLWLVVLLDGRWWRW